MADRQWNTQFSKICYWYFLIIAITAVSSATASFTMEYLVNNCSFLYPHRSNSVSILIWILYILTNFFSFAHTFVNRDSKMCQENKVWILQYCRVGWYCCFILCSTGGLSSFSELTAWYSASMIVILYIRKNSVEHIHSMYGSCRNSLESRVFQNIMNLVSAFLEFCTLSPTLRGYNTLLYNNYQILVIINYVPSPCFP